MRNVYGRDCTLTLRINTDYYPLPYKEETVREEETGYYLDASIKDGNEPAVFIRTGYTVTGCVVTRLETATLQRVLSILSNDSDSFDFIIDRITECRIYEKLTVHDFELRAENGGAFYLKLNVQGTKDSTISDWPINKPHFDWIRGRTLLFDGHTLTAEKEKLPLVYLMSLTGMCRGIRKRQLSLHAPLSSGSILGTARKMPELTIPLNGCMRLTCTGLVPVSDLADVDCGDTVLVTRKFRIAGTCTAERIGTGAWSVTL
ncbi:MAG: hypothetical protein M0P01_09655 [Treponema sp.]|nr:hypothetical protein [Treponema sp.]